MTTSDLIWKLIQELLTKQSEENKPEENKD